MSVESRGVDDRHVITHRDVISERARFHLALQQPGVCEWPDFAM
jgi:hypothetical protein